MSVWIVIALAAAITYGQRAVFLTSASPRPLPRLVARAFAMIPSAALAALVVTSAMGTQRVAGGPSTIHALALGVGAVVSWRTKNVFLTIMSGMLVVWIGAMVLR